MSDVIAGSLIILGGAFAIIGGLGLLRMPDVLIRMHASTKIGTLSTGLILVGCAIVYASPDVIIRAIAIMLFILLTAPIGAHMMGRSVLSTGVPLWKGENVPDDMTSGALLDAHDDPQDSGPRE
jgi:multicomponent Na+:H+ antiporter subunit G